MKKLILFALIILAFTFTATTQEAVRVNISIADNAADNRNLDAFVAKYGCFVDASADNATKRTQRRACREAAVLQLMQDVEDSYEADNAVSPARQAAIDVRKARWQAGVVRPTPTPTPVP